MSCDGEDFWALDLMHWEVGQCISERRVYFNRVMGVILKLKQKILNILC